MKKLSASVKWFLTGATILAVMIVLACFTNLGFAWYCTAISIIAPFAAVSGDFDNSPNAKAFLFGVGLPGMIAGKIIKLSLE